jgi:hypothetical protein
MGKVGNKKRPLGKATCKWEDIVKFDITEK